jgi:hypothetical protein
MLENKLKILFRLDEEDWHGHATETLWAEPVEGSNWTRFTVLNSPFFVTGLSFLDIVCAAPRVEHHIFDFTSIAERYGHSTYMLLVDDEDAFACPDWKHLARMGCFYESMHIDLSIGRKLLLSVDVPDLVDIAEAHAIIAAGEARGRWLYQVGDTTFTAGMLPIA